MSFFVPVDNQSLRTSLHMVQRGRALAVLAVVVLSLASCHSAAYTVATLKNSYDFRLKVTYGESCPPAPANAPSWCLTYYQKLLSAKSHLDLATVAVHAGGGLPLQVDQIKKDAKALAVTK